MRQRARADNLTVCYHKKKTDVNLLIRAIHSAVTVHLEATDTWAYNVDHGEINAVVFLDLIKAFDSVDNEFLLSKLSNMATCTNGLSHILRIVLKCAPSTCRSLKTVH